MHARAFRTRARSAVLWWSGAFLFLQAALALSLDNWMAPWRDPNYVARHRRLVRLIERHPGRPVVVAVGSSRTMNGLCPAVLPDDDRQPILVNWGFPGHAPVHVALRAEQLLRQGPRPAALVLEVVPAYLNTAWNEPGPVPAVAHRWSDLSTVSEIVPSELVGDWRDARLLPWFGYRMHIMDSLAPAWQPKGQRADAFWRGLDEWGWFGTLATGPSEDSRRQVVALFSPCLQRAEPHPDQLIALRHVLATCRDQQILVALMLMPESPEFRASYAPGVRARLCTVLQRLCTEFGSGLVDAGDWFDTEDVFCDGHHLVPAGARLFTPRFARDVVAPLLAGDLDTRKNLVYRHQAAGN
jgi:hypothetical protein